MPLNPLRIACVQPVPKSRSAVSELLRLKIKSKSNGNGNGNGNGKQARRHTLMQMTISNSEPAPVGAFGGYDGRECGGSNNDVSSGTLFSPSPPPARTGVTSGLKS